MGVLAPHLRTLDAVARPPLTQAYIFGASVCKITECITPKRLKIESPDLVGYVKFTPKYIIEGGAILFFW